MDANGAPKNAAHTARGNKEFQRRTNPLFITSLSLSQRNQA
jgi:hypothetical protein